MKQLSTLILIFFTTFCFCQEWEQVASLPDNFNTHHSFAFSIDGTGYMVAGSTLSDFSDSFYSYDAELDEWTKKEDFPGIARGFAIGVVHGSKAYFGFGTSNFGRLDDLWEYDPATDAWTELATCECDGRIHPAMIALNGEIYLGLGGTTNGNVNDWWVYNIENNEWEERERFPGDPRHHPFQFTDGEYVYAGFGHGDGFISNQWYRYNPSDDSWLEVERLPAEGRVAGTQMSYNGLGLILSGDGDDHGVMNTGEFWMYDPSFDSWTALTPHPGVSRWAPTSFIINDEMYLLNGERDGNHIAENYKFDISFLNIPTLNIATSDDPITFINTDDNCNSVHMKSIEVGTRNAFEVDTEVSIEVDPSSTAVEGDDFVLNESTAILLAGENEINFDLLIFDDAVVNEDRTIVLNLVADVEVANDKVTIELEENDIEFASESIERTLEIGEGEEQTIAPFARFYTNARSQMLYRSEMLTGAGVEAGLIEQIGFDVMGDGGQQYNDFTVSIATTNIDQFTNGPILGLNFEEVFQGNYTTQGGINEIFFDSPYDYDGESNLVIQICFDNAGYTVDEFSASTNVGYTSTVVLQEDFVTGCPSGGILTSATALPNLFLKKDGFLPLYTRLNTEFQSEIIGDESIFFTQNDSILASITTVSSSDAACFSTELVSNSNEINSSENIDWIDRIYAMSHDAGEPSNYEVTYLVPTVEFIDFESESLSGLYTAVDPTSGNNPDWVEVEPMIVEINEAYVSVTIPYQGSGYYAVGGVELSTSTFEQEIDLTFDQVTLYDAMGRRIASHKTNIQTSELPVGVYFLIYSNEGKLVKTEKVIR